MPRARMSWTPPMPSRISWREAAIPVRLVQPGGDLAIVGGIAGRVGVQQIQLDPPHTHHPDLRMESAAPEAATALRAALRLILDQLQRQRGEIVFGILGDLPPVPVDLLPEIPAPMTAPTPTRGYSDRLPISGDRRTGRRARPNRSAGTRSSRTPSRNRPPGAPATTRRSPLRKRPCRRQRPPLWTYTAAGRTGHAPR